MKHTVIILILALILCSPCVAATTSEEYTSYNARMGTLVFKEIAIMERANDVFKQWIRGEIARMDAEIQLSAYIYMLDTIHGEITGIKPSSELSSLHAIYSESSSAMEQSVKKHLEFVRNNDLKSDRIREKIRSHLLGYVQAAYDSQIRNMESQQRYQEQMKLEKEPDSIKKYLAWNNSILKIMTSQAGISKEMELMLVNLSTGGIDIEEAEKEEKEIRAKVEALRHQLDEIRPDSKFSELHRQFVLSYDSYQSFHRMLTDYLDSPTKEKAEKLSEITKQSNKLSFDFNEACSRYLTEHSRR